MKYLAVSIVLVGSIAAAAVFAAAPAGAPSGSTGIRNDATYSSSAEKKGAWRGHEGVKAWFEGSTEAPATETSTTAAGESG